jgi:biopolymer transport protein ExbD
MKYIFTLLIAIALTSCATIGTQTKIDIVKIDKDGNVQLNGKQMPVTSLSESFKNEAVVIEADSSTSHGKVMAVIKETTEAGITNVSFKTQNNKKQ